MDSSLHISEICKSFQSTYKNKFALEKGYGFHLSTSRHKPQVIILLRLTLNFSEPDYLVCFQWLHWAKVILVLIFVSKPKAY